MEKNLSEKLELRALSAKHQFIAYCQSCIEKKHLVEETGSQGGKVDSIAFPPLAEIVHRIIAFRWVQIHICPQAKKKTPIWVSFWWGKVDSNHRSYKQQIYSLSPLATREFPHIHFELQFPWSR